MILNTINNPFIPMLKYFFCSDFYCSYPPSGIEGKIIMGVFQKASWNKCKTTQKITTSAAATLTSSKNKSPNPPLGFLKKL
jgi:hypothetical protein